MPIVHPGIIIITFSVLAAYLIIFGAFSIGQARKLTYDDSIIHTNGVTEVKSLTLKGVDVSKPLFIYYRIPNFYQNVRSYAQAFSIGQLTQKSSMADELVDANCASTTREKAVEHPCGLQYATFPRDIYTL